MGHSSNAMRSRKSTARRTSSSTDPSLLPGGPRRARPPRAGAGPSSPGQQETDVVGIRMISVEELGRGAFHFSRRRVHPRLCAHRQSVPPTPQARRETFPLGRERLQVSVTTRPRVWASSGRSRSCRQRRVRPNDRFRSYGGSLQTRASPLSGVTRVDVDTCRLFRSHAELRVRADMRRSGFHARPPGRAPKVLHTAHSGAPPTFPPHAGNPRFATVDFPSEPRVPRAMGGSHPG